MKTCLIVTMRFYSRKSAPRKTTRRKPIDAPNPGIHGRIKMLKETEDLSKIEDLNEIIDGEDYGQFESDFMNASRVHVEHEKYVFSMFFNLLFSHFLFVIVSFKNVGFKCFLFVLILFVLFIFSVYF